MSRATGPEAVRAGKEVLLIHRLQHHDDCSLRQLIFEGRDAERPTRAIRLLNICPTHWRRLVATRLDAIQEVQEIGFQVCRIVVRHHTVDARSTILAGEPVGFFHPFQIDDVVQRGQRHFSFRSCQFSYPLSLRGQVCETQGPLPCFSSTVLFSWHPSFLDRVPVSPGSPMSAVILRCYDFPARIPGHLFVSLPGPTLPSSVRVSQLALALPEGRRVPSGPGSLFNRRPELPVCSHVDVSGISQVPRRSILCLCPVLRPRPNRRPLAYLTVSSMLPPLFQQRRLQRLMNFGALLRGFSTCCLRFKSDVATTHAKLASGWLARLYREGVEPSGSLQKVSDHTLVPLFWIYPGATEFSCRPPLVP